MNKEDTIWLRRLQDDGHVFAKVLLISEPRVIFKNKKEKKEFDIKISELCDISTKEIYETYGITSNANHGNLIEKNGGENE